MNLFDLLTNSNKTIDYAKNMPPLQGVQLNEDGSVNDNPIVENEVPVTVYNRFENKAKQVGNNLFNRLLGEQTQPTDYIDTSSSDAINAGISNNPRVGGIIPDIMAGFKENATTPFNVNNFGQNNGAAYRIGEGLGSVARMVNSPLGRGLAVAGLVGLSGGTGAEALGYGLQTAVGNQQNVLNDRLYRQSLINNYGYTPEQLNAVGYVGKDTFKNLADSSYKNQLNSYRNRRLDQNSYIKMVNELDKLHKAGQIPDDVYLASIRDLNEQYTTSNTYNIADIGASNDTRKTDSQIALNDARIENYKNPKPRVNISYRYGDSKVTHTHTGGNGGKTNTGNGKPIGASSNNGRVKMEYQGKYYWVDANRVPEYQAQGGKVVQ